MTEGTCNSIHVGGREGGRKKIEKQGSRDGGMYPVLVLIQTPHTYIQTQETV